MATVGLGLPWKRTHEKIETHDTGARMMRYLFPDLLPYTNAW